MTGHARSHLPAFVSCWRKHLGCKLPLSAPHWQALEEFMSFYEPLFYQAQVDLVGAETRTQNHAVLFCSANPVGSQPRCCCAECCTARAHCMLT